MWRFVGPFMAVPLAHDLTLGYYEVGVLARVVERGLDYWADPYHRQANRINTNDGGRGFYFEDPDGHNLEVLTRSYGSGE